MLGTMMNVKSGNLLPEPLPEPLYEPLYGQVARWIDDFAEPARAESAIAALGERAVPALRDYLARGPQSIPQARCFAVAMLARLHGAAATAALREVLRAHPRETLAPAFVDAEYVVQSDVLGALCRRAYPELADDIAWGVHERLRRAVAAAGTHGLAELAGGIADLLDDDVLADAAVGTLAKFGSVATAIIAARLPAWLDEAAGSVRRRLALLRALEALRHLHAGLDVATAGRASRAEHPAVRAAAALLAWPARRDGAAIEAVLRGAVGCDRALVNDCRAVLEHAGVDCAAAARRALRRDAEPDIYGDPRPLSADQRDWLTRCLHGFPEVCR